MYDTSKSPNLETAVNLYLEQLHNYELWLAGEEAEEALDAIVSAEAA